MKNLLRKIESAATMARTYIESRIYSASDPYTLAIASYALTLAKSFYSDIVLAKLNSQATIKGNHLLFLYQNKFIFKNNREKFPQNSQSMYSVENCKTRHQIETEGGSLESRIGRLIKGIKHGTGAPVNQELCFFFFLEISPELFIKGHVQDRQKKRPLNIS